MFVSQDQRAGDLLRSVSLEMEAHHMKVSDDSEENPDIVSTWGCLFQDWSSTIGLLNTSICFVLEDEGEARPVDPVRGTSYEPFGVSIA